MASFWRQYNSVDLGLPVPWSYQYDQDEQVRVRAALGDSADVEGTGVTPGTGLQMQITDANKFTVTLNDAGTIKAFLVGTGGVTVNLSAAPGTAGQARWDYISINNAGTLSVTTGSAGLPGAITPPTPPANSVVLGKVYVQNGATSVGTNLTTYSATEAKYFDMRMPFVGMNVQAFLTAGAHTWVKPPNVKWVRLILIGGGGGGGSGCVASSSNNNGYGGGGGGPGGVADYIVPASLLGQTQSVTVGAGGAGGAAVTAAGATAGNDGAAGGLTSCASMFAQGGRNGGGGGTGAAGTAGRGGYGNVAGQGTPARPGTNAVSNDWSVNGRYGGTGAGGSAGTAGSHDQIGPGGGGGGGGHIGAGATTAGGAGGDGPFLGAISADTKGGTVGAGGSNGSNGGNGVGQGTFVGAPIGGGGGGGGGGASGANGIGGDGGDGALFGGGGGGGGNGNGTGDSGAGGDGGAGCAVLMSWTG